MIQEEDEQTRREKACAALRRALEAEEALAAINAPLVEADWLQKMRTAKVAELTAESEGLTAAHAARVSRQADALHASFCSLASLQEGMEAVQEAHRQALDSIFAAHGSHVQSLLELHSGALTLLAREGAAEEAEASQAHGATMKLLEAETYGLRAAHNAAQRSATVAFNSRRRAVVEECDERSGVTRMLGEEAVRALAEAVHRVQDEATAATREDRRRHKELAAEDAQDAAILESRDQKLLELQQEVEAVQRRMAADKEAWQRRAADAKEAKVQALEQYVEAQRDVQNARKRHEKRMQMVSSASAAVESELEEVVATAERVVKAMQLKEVKLQRLQA